MHIYIHSMCALSVHTQLELNMHVRSVQYDLRLNCVNILQENSVVYKIKPIKGYTTEYILIAFYSCEIDF